MGVARGAAALVALLPCMGMVAEPPGPCEGCAAVYYSGLNGSRCFRIPTIIKTHLGTLLAFAENRVTGCGDDTRDLGDGEPPVEHRHDIVVRRSHDLGRSWGPMITVRRGEVPCAGCPAATSNPNPVEVRLPDGTHRVLLHYDTMNNPHPDRHGLDMQVWSGDDGLTWGDDSALNFPPEVNAGGMIGPSVGLQGASGTIYFSARQVDGIEPAGNFLYWSTDYGRTWVPSEPLPSLSSETSIAWLHNSSDERIVMNIRNGSRRLQVVFGRDGTPGPITRPAGLVDPDCQGSVLNQAGALYLSNANMSARGQRSHMTVKGSADQGVTWGRGALVWSGPSAYSQLVDLDGVGRLGLLFEAGEAGPYETISWVTLDAPLAEAAAAPDLEILI